MRLTWLVLLFTGLAACQSKSTIQAPPEPAAGCNPIIGDDCTTPYPSRFFETADSTTATQVRVSIADGILPTQVTGIPISPARLNQKDGFSPSTNFIVYFANGVDATNLGNWQDPSASLTAAGPVQVIDEATGERVIAFGELDVHDTTTSNGRQALLIRPLQRLTPGHTYVIALVGLTDPNGNDLTPTPFKALRDGTPLSHALTAIAPTYPGIWAALATAGVERSKVTLAWDVVVASDSTATSHLLAMRDQALALVDAGALTYTITDAGMDDATDPSLHAQISALIQVPNFLKDTSGTSEMNFDDAGMPLQNGFDVAHVTISVPKCVETATTPTPVLVFGHGLFGNALQTMQNPTLTSLGNQWCITLIGTDWIGLSSYDVTNLQTFLEQDLNNVYIITDRLQQAHVNAQTMTRLFMTSIMNDPLLQWNGHPMADPSTIYYFGVSNGGIQGTTFMGLSPDVPMGVLNVPGGAWSLLIPRSADFDPFNALLLLALPDPLDQQLAISASQSDWDYADSATFAPHLLANPLPGVAVKQILMQESIGDAQVTNVATRMLARTMGIPSLDLTDPVPGLTGGTAPLSSAYTQYNSDPTPFPPSTDTALPADNGAHDSVWQSTLAQSQINQFLQPQGMVQSVCNGPCNIPNK